VTPVQPRFEHDCEKCVFLGRLGLPEGYYDLYFCEQGRDFPTVIARFGDDGPDYNSGLAAADQDPALRVAKRLAEEKGLLM
jgi:hypothetical protein